MVQSRAAAVAPVAATPALLMPLAALVRGSAAVARERATAARPGA